MKAEKHAQVEAPAQTGVPLNLDPASLIDALLDTLVKKVLIPEIHKYFGGTVPLNVLNDATRLLLDGIKRGEAGSTFQTGKQLVLFALNEALRTVDEARS